MRIELTVMPDDCPAIDAKLAAASIAAKLACKEGIALGDGRTLKVTRIGSHMATDIQDIDFLFATVIE